MPASAEVMHKTLGGLHVRVARNLTNFWGTLNLGDPAAARNALLAYVPALVERYGLQSAQIAADWYEELRAAERVPGAYQAQLAGVIAPEYVQKSVRFGAQHLWTPTPAEFVAFMSSAASGWVTTAFADTIELNVEQDSATARWIRKPQPGACNFCLILASRASLNAWQTGRYTSERSADRVVGRGRAAGVATDRLGRSSVRGGGVKGRGSQALGDPYHDDCRCVAVPVWAGTNIQAEHGFDPEELYARYNSGEFDDTADRMTRR